MANNQFKGKQNNRNGGYQNNWSNEPKRLPEGYLVGGYYYQPDESDKPVLRKEYILGYPVKIAGSLAEKDRNLNKSSQIRKYYDYCIRIRDLISSGRKYEEVESEFYRLANFVSYAESRKLVTPLFVEFIEKNIENIHNNEDFNAFVKHFEAVVAHLKEK